MGNSDYKGEWQNCAAGDDDGGVKYDCTPWGFVCAGDETTAEKCPLGYGGESDGCQPPNLISTLINIALDPGNVEELMYDGQPWV